MQTHWNDEKTHAPHMAPNQTGAYNWTSINVLFHFNLNRQRRENRRKFTESTHKKCVLNHRKIWISKWIFQIVQCIETIFVSMNEYFFSMFHSKTILMQKKNSSILSKNFSLPFSSEIIVDVEKTSIWTDLIEVVFFLLSFFYSTEIAYICVKNCFSFESIQNQK